jgi:hypothetical protein
MFNGAGSGIGLVTINLIWIQLTIGIEIHKVFDFDDE